MWAGYGRVNNRQNLSDFDVQNRSKTSTRVGRISIRLGPDSNVNKSTTPLRVTSGEIVQLCWNLDNRPRCSRVTDVVFTLVGVGVPLTGRFVPTQRLIRVALTALDRNVTNIDIGHRDSSKRFVFYSIMLIVVEILYS